MTNDDDKPNDDSEEQMTERLKAFMEVCRLLKPLSLKPRRQRNLAQQQTMFDLAPQFGQKDDQGKVTGYDTNGYYNSLLSSGKVDPNKVFEMRNQQALMQKNLADAGTAAIGLQDKKNNDAYQILEGVRGVVQQKGSTPEMQQQAYASAIPKLQGLGMDTSQYPANFAQVGQRGLDQFEVGLAVHKQQRWCSDTISSWKTT